MLGLCRTDERDKSRGCLHTMPCKEEEDKVNVSKLNKVKQVQHDIMINVDSRKASGRRDARRANSRGFLNPWYNWQEKKMASAKTRTCGEGCRSASLQTPLLCNQKAEGLKAPGYSFPRLSDVLCSTFSFDVHRSLSRHPELVSGSVRGEELERLAVRC